MKDGVLSELLTPPDTTVSIDAKLSRTLRRVVKLTGATAGALVFLAARPRPFRAVVGTPRPPRVLRDWLRRVSIGAPPRGARVRATSGAGVRAGTVLFEAPLGPRRGPVGALALVGPASRLRGAVLPSAWSRELGTAIERVWRFHERTLRMSVIA